MQVYVVKTAFYRGSLVHPSDKAIEVPDDLKGSWFVPADAESAEAAKAAAKGNKATPSTPQTLSELGKGAGQSFNEVHGGKQPAKAAAKGNAGGAEG